MAYKSFDVTGVGTVNIYKRRGSTNIRLSVTNKGVVRVNLPAWLPYSAGLSFVNKRADWLESQLAVRTRTVLKDGDRIGKSNRLMFAYRPDSLKPSSRLKPNLIVINTSLPSDSPQVQSVALKACERALKIESETLLIQRLSALAKKYNLKYNSASIKKLTSRWGSCSSKNDIVLSLYLIQLDWKLIDYVLLHELTHTKHKHHGADFWDHFEEILPGAKATRKLLNHNQTIIVANP